MGLYQNNFAEAFSKLIDKFEVTAYQIHQFIHLDQAYLSRLKSGEKNNPSPETIMKISLAFCHFIHFLGDMATPAEISRWLLREPHMISALLNKLEEQGLIKKARDSSRKNIIRLSLTERGYDAYHKTLPRKSMHKIISCLSEEKQRQLWSYLERLRAKALENVEADIKPPFPPQNG